MGILVVGLSDDGFPVVTVVFGMVRGFWLLAALLALAPDGFESIANDFLHDTNLGRCAG